MHSCDTALVVDVVIKITLQEQEQRLSERVSCTMHWPESYTDNL